MFLTSTPENKSIRGMPVESSHLTQLALGQKTELFVGDLPRPVAKYLGCHPAVVYLGRDEFLKIAKGHPEIEHEEFQSLPMLIKSGRYIKDDKRPNCVTVFYRAGDDRLYTAGIKATCGGSEAWIQTFHRTTDIKAQRREERHGYLIGSPCY